MAEVVSCYHRVANSSAPGDTQTIELLRKLLRIQRSCASACFRGSL